MIRTMGKVFLDSVQFTTDPHISRAWPPRRSKKAGIEGSTTFQDFGRFAKDMRLTLNSGENYANQAFVSAIEDRMQTRLAVYTYTDYQGLDADVVIVDFTPVATFIKDSKGVLFTYTLTLDVVALRKLNFKTYTGK
jgi:hypothetical protein